MVKDQVDSEIGIPLPPHELLFPISIKDSFICTIPDRITHTTAFVTPVVEHWLEREIVQWVNNEGSIRRPISPWAKALTIELYLAVQKSNVLFNNIFNIFYLWLYGIAYMVKDHRDRKKGGGGGHCIYFRLEPSHRQDSTYHNLCYNNHGAMAGMRNLLLKLLRLHFLSHFQI